MLVDMLVGILLHKRQAYPLDVDGLRFGHTANHHGQYTQPMLARFDT